MRRGETPTRARRRQSDAKWRASVAMCYDIMKTVIPEHKKMGRRKISKALTLKETERHILNLEGKIKELIDYKAQQYGKRVMIESDDQVLYPSTLEHIKQDFAIKQLSFFASTSNGKKRYNVPTDIEASLENLSQQACPLVVIDRDNQDVAGEVILQSNGEQEQQDAENDRRGTLQNLFMVSLADFEKSETLRKKSLVNPQKTTPLKTKHFSTGTCTTTDIAMMTPRKSPASEGCTSDKAALQDQRVPEYEECCTASQTDPPRTLLKTKTCTTPSKTKNTFGSSGCAGGTGFTPIKLPTLGLDTVDLLSLPSTPGKSTITASPFSTLSLPETPSSGLKGFDYLDFTDDEENTSLLCTESIDSMDLDDAVVQDSTPCRSKTQSSELDMPSKDVTMTESFYSPSSQLGNTDCRRKRKSNCRRRLDQSYSDANHMEEYEEKSCLDFDEYLMLYRHHAEGLNETSELDEKSLNMAAMWESSGQEDKTSCSALASVQQSDDSQDLSNDLLDIDLKPLDSFKPKQHVTGEVSSRKTVLHKGHNDLDLSQQMPDLDLTATLLTSVHPECSKYNLQLVPEYEDLGILYSQETEIGTDYTTDNSQIVPELDCM